jgi:hypothetical protein
VLPESRSNWYLGEAKRRCFTSVLASRTMLGECCLAAIQPKGFWTKLRAQKRERVCVCERERERERGKI